MVVFELKTLIKLQPNIGLIWLFYNLAIPKIYFSTKLINNEEDILLVLYSHNHYSTV